MTQCIDNLTRSVTLKLKGGENYDPEEDTGLAEGVAEAHR